MNTKWRLFRYSFAAAALMAGCLLALSLASQTRPAGAKSDSSAKSESSAAYMPGCCGINEELQQFYLGLPRAKKPTPRAPDGHAG